MTPISSAGNNLLRVVRSGQRQELRGFFEQEKLVEVDKFCGKKQMTPLMEAIRLRHYDLAEMLIDEYKANVRLAQPETGFTAIHFLARFWWVGFEHLSLDMAKKLQAAGANLDARDSRGWTPLHVACSKNVPLLVEYLCAMAANVNAKTAERETPLFLACCEGYGRIVRILLERKHHLDILATNLDGRSPLFVACCDGRTQIVNILLEQAEKSGVAEECILAQDLRGLSPLHAASAGRHVDIMKILIGKGAPINKTTHTGKTPLLHLCTSKYEVRSMLNQDRSSTAARLLIDSGADIEAGTQIHGTPLCASCSMMRDVARALILKGANVNATIPCTGKTPLHMVCMGYDSNLARELIQRGADTTAKTNDGETPLILACRSSRHHMVEVLLEDANGARVVNEATNDGVTPLHIAAEVGGSRIIRALLRAGADLNSTSSGCSPLYVTLRQERSDLARILLDRNADVTIADAATGESPLHLACSMGSLELVKELVRRGADVHAVTTSGETPLFYAGKGGFLEIVRYLIYQEAAFAGV